MVILNKKNSKICSKFDTTNNFLQKKINDDLNFIINSRRTKTNFKYKIFKVMKFKFKTTLSHFLLSMTFQRSHLILLHLSTYHNNRGHHEIKSNLCNICYHFRHLTMKSWFEDTKALRWSTLLEVGLTQTVGDYHCAI